MAPALLLLLILIGGYRTETIVPETTTKITKKSDYTIQIDESNITCEVDSKFVSVTISVGQFNKTLSVYDFKSAKLRTLLKELSPSYIRIGGAKANFLFFEPRRDPKVREVIIPYTRDLAWKPINGEPGRRSFLPRQNSPKEQNKMKQKAMEKENNLLKDLMKKEKKKKEITPDERYEDKIRGLRNFKLNASVFDSLYDLINSTGNKMIFDINAFPRLNGTQNWNSSNAVELFKHVTKKKYDIDWQLGNEPNHYKIFGEKYEQIGDNAGTDYTLLKIALIKSNQTKSKVVGPDITPPKEQGKLQSWLREFFKKAGDTIDAFAWHQYYINGKEAKEEDFINPEVLDKFVGENKYMKDVLNENNFTKPVWLTETGSAWGGGAKDLSDRFAGMFPYVDKLGVSGENCIQVVARQDLFGGRYAMVNKTGFSPHPEYYAAVLFKRLAARGVLQISINNFDKKFRVYGRCARTSENTLPGSVFVFIINLYNETKTFSFADYQLFKTKQYLFTADSLSSDVVKLNDEPLIIKEDKLPKMTAIFVEQPIKIPAHSIGFYILDLVSLPIC